MTFVSVVMPVFDAGPFLAEALDSLLAQTHRDFEIIVADDGSTDASPEVVEDYARRDSRVSLIRLERDPALPGGARAANRGIAAARGDYVARMDQDDIARPERLAVQLAFLEARGLDACGSAARAFGAGADFTYRYPETPEAFERELVFRVGLLHPTMLATAELMKRLPYDERTAHDDYEWQTRAVAAGARFGNCPEVLLDRRHHAAQSNILQHARFVTERRRYRFGHFYRLFPNTPVREFHIVNALADGARLADREELEIAGKWLQRLAAVPETAFRETLARRWEKACERAAIAGTGELKAAVRAGILAAG